MKEGLYFHQQSTERIVLWQRRRRLTNSRDFHIILRHGTVAKHTPFGQVIAQSFQRFVEHSEKEDGKPRSNKG